MILKRLLQCSTLPTYNAFMMKLHGSTMRDRSKTQVPGSLVSKNPSFMNIQLMCRCRCASKSYTIRSRNLQDTDVNWWYTKGYTCCTTAFQGQCPCRTAMVLSHWWQGLDIFPTTFQHSMLCGSSWPCDHVFHKHCLGSVWDFPRCWLKHLHGYFRERF